MNEVRECGQVARRFANAALAEVTFELLIVQICIAVVISFTLALELVAVLSYDAPVNKLIDLASFALDIELIAKDH